VLEALDGRDLAAGQQGKPAQQQAIAESMHRGKRPPENLARPRRAPPPRGGVRGRGLHEIGSLHDAWSSSVVGENARLTFVFRSYAPRTLQNDDSRIVGAGTGAVWPGRHETVASCRGLRNSIASQISARIMAVSIDLVDAAQRNGGRRVSCDQRKPR
jgi:hypothetical protein